MNEAYTITQVEKMGDAEWTAIGSGISDYNEQHSGPENTHRVSFAIKDADDTTLGGITCLVYWGWLYIDLLYLPENLRGQGYGHQLLTLAEEEARRLGAKKAYLDTFSFQSPDFYKDHGYEVFGELHDFPPGHQRYFMSKVL